MMSFAMYTLFVLAADAYLKSTGNVHGV